MYNIPTTEDVKEYGVTLGFEESIPVMKCNGKTFNGMVYCLDPYKDRPYIAAAKRMYDNGVRIFSFLIPLPVCWDKKGEIDFTLVDEVHDNLLEVCPEGLFYPRVFLETPTWWDEENPEELVKFNGENHQILDVYGKKEHLWKYETKVYHGVNNPSIASDKWKGDAGQVFSEYVKHTQSGKYAGHFIGYHIAYGNCGEWGQFGQYFNNRIGDFDFSAPMINRFRIFLKEKYKTDFNLQTAWKDASVTLNTALPCNKIEKLTSHIGFLRDPDKSQKYSDWTHNYSKTLYDAIIHFGRVAKETAKVPVLTGTFAGYRIQLGASAYSFQCTETNLDYLLSSPYIDMLHTPNGYQNRDKGVFSQAPIATIAHKKIFMAENDVRTYLASGNILPYYGGYETGDAKASLNDFMLNTLYNFLQGSGHLWWYDFGFGWYMDEPMDKFISAIEKVSRSLAYKDRSAQAEIAFVIDEESNVYTEGASDYYRLSRETILKEMIRCGAPFDVITGDDLLNRPAYKLYIFRDMFYASDERAEEIRKFLKESSASAVWLYACGTLNDDGFDVKNAKRLTNINLNKLDNVLTNNHLTVLNYNHEVTKGLKNYTQGTLGNDDTRGVYSPILYVEDKDATILGQIEPLEIPGIAIKEDNNRFDMWLSAPLITCDFLYNIAKYAGCHMYIESGHVIFGKGNIFTVIPNSSEPILFTPKEDVTGATDLFEDKKLLLENKKVVLEKEKNSPVLFRLTNN